MTESKTQHGNLLLADISGYTSYVAKTELEHSQAVLSELLELLLKHLTPTLTLAKLEGDAVFAYAPESRLSRGETILELMETTYVAFRDRVEGIRRRTTCDCNACRAIPTLDLKFMAHYGDYIVQNVAGISELVGSDVNLVHRLAKNHVSETTGWQGYALFTEQCLEHTSAKPEGMHAQVESYEHLGDVQTYSMNLRSRYNQLSEARRVFLSAAEADFTITHDFSAPRTVVWEWLNEPQKRTLWMHERIWSVLSRPSGRTGVGARNHCSHSKGSIVETILDWRPFDYVTTEQTDGQVQLAETIQLEPLPDGRGTRLHNHLKLTTSMPPWLTRRLSKFMLTRMAKYKNAEVFARMAKLMAEEQSP